MPEPAVVVAIREFKESLLQQEAAWMQEMAGRWLQVEASLEAQISALARDLADMRALGLPISESQVYTLRRYQRLLVQARGEFERYARWAGDKIEAHQAILAELGLDHAQAAIQLSYWPGVFTGFDMLPVEAIENMVGLAGNGSPLYDLLQQRMIEASGALERLTSTLVRGTALGWNPRRTARAMRDDLSGGLQRALTIARTEQMRVYREANRRQFEESGVVEGYKRISAHDPRVCAACLADEGTFYSVYVDLDDHPQGRCAMVPVVRDMPEVNWLSGEDWLLTQDAATQVSILGQGHYEAWQAGAFSFRDLVTRRYDPIWGGSITPTPLYKLTA